MARLTFHINTNHWRMLLLAAVLVSIYFSALALGLFQDLTPVSVREQIQAAGALGVGIYLLMFCLGLLVYVPGTLFMVVAGMAFGSVQGGLLAWFGANLAILVSFYLVRTVGGQPVAQLDNPRLQRWTNTLHSRPVRNVAVMRFLLSTAPGLNYFLALSGVHHAPHLVGTLLGTIVPVAVVVVLSDWFLLAVF